jgi:hypothetical protein
MEPRQMKPHRIAINRIALWLALFSACAMAHGGLEHVMGTVAKISDTSLTVTTTQGKTVEILLDSKTTYSRGNQPIQKSALKIGDRVVIHAEKSGVKLTAHTVETGAATASKTAQH